MFDYEDFKKLLSSLNKKLKKNELHTKIFAIGGFAMMCNARAYDFESRGFSVDIDSYMNYSEKILKLVDEVSVEFGILSERWLNTHWHDRKEGFDENIESFSDWKWEKTADLVFSNIEFYYGNLEGLLKMKLSAIDEKLELDKLGVELGFSNAPIGVSVRKNDLVDVKMILDFFDENDFDNIKQSKIAKMFAEYKLAVEFLKMEAKRLT